jgi:hypothetical protein
MEDFSNCSSFSHPRNCVGRVDSNHVFDDKQACLFSFLDLLLVHWPLALPELDGLDTVALRPA